MTVHAFPGDRNVADRHRRGRDPSRAGSDRVELWLVGGLVAATAIQFALCLWFWLG